ncbi:MAG: putative ABC transporter permease [Bacilli bacterium]|nr:putative ABC transporter permease [Bacilli bacterium]
MIYDYILLFLIYSVIGWTMEVVVSLVYRHRFINRGFLIGPCCPIYGFGGLFITIFLTRYKDDMLVFFVMTMFICTILEYFTSYIMEKLFKARWWDYSQKKFHINGRVCIDAMFGFAAVGGAVIYILNPFLTIWLGNTPYIVKQVTSIVLMLVFIIDVIVSLVVMSNLKHVKYKNKDNTEEITKKTKEALREKNFFTKRLVDAFPDFEVLKKKTKEKIDQTKKEIKKKQKEIKKMRKKIKISERELKKISKRDK